MHPDTYSKFALAHLYGWSVRTLARELRRIEPELCAVGYTRKRHYLTPAMVRIIFEIWGTPPPKKKPA